MTEAADWETWLAAEFPGFLLPHSMHKAIESEVAARFLSRFGRPDHLQVLLASAVFSRPSNALALNRFVHDEIPSLVSALPSRTRPQPQLWEDGYQGRLDVKATLAERLLGRPNTFVTRARVRDFDLPETVLLSHVMVRIRDELARLRGAGLLPGAAWSGPVDNCESRLNQLLQGTVLRNVEVREIEPGDLQAARSAREPAYGRAAEWYDRLTRDVDASDPVRLAQLVSEGALAPCSKDTRFEIAVVLRLLWGLWRYLDAEQSGRWTLSQDCVHAGRTELGSMTRDDGTRLAVYYNKSILEPGPRTLGVAHYLGATSPLRPDWTVLVTLPGKPNRYVVGEVKNTDSVSYSRQGFSEAVLYRFEYAAQLTGRLKSVLTVPGHVAGAPRAEDATIACGWRDWPPLAVLEGIAEGVLEQGA